MSDVARPVSSSAARAMPETRLPCPVCLGVMMDKIGIATARTRVADGGPGLVLDHCRRCGGIWFEQGEVGRLRALRPRALWTSVLRRDRPQTTPCHNCHAPIERIGERCPACSEPLRLECPECTREMKVVTHDGVVIDACMHCRGAWFDHSELAHIWNLQLDRAYSRRGNTRVGEAAAGAAGDGALTIVEILAWSPDLVIGGAWLASNVAGAGIEAAANAPGAIASAGEAAGEAAAGVFETIVEIIGGIFG